VVEDAGLLLGAGPLHSASSTGKRHRREADVDGEVEAARDTAASQAAIAGRGVAAGAVDQHDAQSASVGGQAQAPVAAGRAAGAGRAAASLVVIALTAS
jgi:hypothetical protein